MDQYYNPYSLILITKRTVNYFLLLLFLCGLSVNAQTIRYVKPGANGTGTSWANASGNLQTMINASAANDQVWVAAGTYQPQYGSSFSMKEGVRIYGGFPSMGTPIISDRNPVVNPTILAGNGSRVITNDNNGLTFAAQLHGFTITGGIGELSGGGIYNNNVSPVYSNLIIRNNNCEVYGGGLYNSGGSPYLVNVSITDNVMGFYSNYVFQKGAGICSIGGEPILMNVLIANNAITHIEGMGGGMHLANGSALFTNVTIAGNSVDGYGAGLYLQNATPYFRNSIIWNDLYFKDANAPGFSNSIVKGSGGSAAWNSSYGTNGARNLDIDPNFTSATNFTLQPMSPAINAATTGLFEDAGASKDLAGNPRVFGASIDMGAYESQHFYTLDKTGVSNVTASPAYSLRQLSTTYTGKAITVRRTDNATMDIGFLANGELDIATLMTFVGSGNGYVTKWFDQSGLGYHATQTNFSLQPLLVESGVLKTLNGRPAIGFSTSNLATIKAILFPNAVSMVGVAKGNTSTPSSFVTKTGTAAGAALNYPAPFDFTNTLGQFNSGSASPQGLNTLALGSTTPRSDVSTTVSASIYGFTIAPGGTVFSYRNGIQNGTVAAAAYADNGNSLMLGNRNDGTGSGNFSTPEILLFNTVLTATQRQALETSERSYYFNANADLSALTTTAGTLTFVPATTSYSVSVANSVTSITVTPTAAQTMSLVEIRINGGTYTTITSATPSSSLALNLGNNTVDIRVRSQDASTVKTYTLTINRALSPNADLSALSTTAGIINFAVATTSYSLTALASSHATVTATPAESAAVMAIRINGGTYTALVNGTASANLPLTIGISNVIDIRVTAPDGVAIKTYTIIIINLTTLDLAGLTTNGSQAPAFALRKLSNHYSGSAVRVRRSSDNTQRDIGFTPQNHLDTAALLTFIGNDDGFVVTWYDQSGLGYDATQATSSRQPRIVNNGVVETVNGRPSLFFPNSSHLATVPVTLYDQGVSMHGVAKGNSTSSSQLLCKTGTSTGSNAIYPAPFAFTDPSGNLTVGSAAAGTAIQGNTVNLSGTSPRFDINSAVPTSTYGFNIPSSGIMSIFRNHLKSADFTVQYYQDNGNSIRIGNRTEISSTANMWTPELMLFKTILTSAERQALETSSQNYYFNTEALLTSLVLGTGTLNTSFSSSTTSYTLTEVPTNSTNMSFTATTSHEMTVLQVRVNGGAYTTIKSGVLTIIDFTDGNNTVDFKVTSQDQSITKVYTVTVPRQSANANPAAITLSSGPLIPQFNQYSENYLIHTAHDQTTVTTTPLNAAATVSISINDGPFQAVANGVASESLALNMGYNTILIKITAENTSTIRIITITINRIVRNSLDLYGLTPATLSVPAYSLRRLSSMYTGPAIRVANSDNTQYQDIGFTADGELDVDALMAFATSQGSHPLYQNVFVQVWYDQSGYGFISRQLEVALQPRIVKDGVLETLNGRPSLYFGNSHIATPKLLLYPEAVSMLAVAKGESSSSSALISKTGTADDLYLHLAAPFDFTNTSGQLAVGNANILTQKLLNLNNTAVSANVLTSIYGFTVPSSGTSYSYRNGIQTGSAVVNGYKDYGNELRIGNRNGGGGVGMMRTPEIVLFDKILTITERQSVEAAMKSYYFNPDATLLSLLPESGALSPAFAPEALAYTMATVPIETTSLSFSATLSNSFASLQWRVNGGSFTSVANGATAIVPIVDDVNTIEFRVTAQDPAITKTYTVSVNRISSNANLASLYTSAGILSPAFQPLETLYAASSIESTASVTALPYVNDATLAISTDGVSYEPMEAGVATSFALQPGNNTVFVKVLANDMNATKIYMLTINRIMRNTLDQIGLTATTTAIPAYSLRKLSGTYNGPVLRVRRNSDNALMDIGFTASGELDVETLLAFTGNSSGHVVRWYDQSGNGYDAFQDIDDYQPTIVIWGTLRSMNKRPSIYFESGTRLQTDMRVAYPNGVSMIGFAKGNYFIPSSLVTKTGTASGQSLNYPAPFDYTNREGAFVVGRAGAPASSVEISTSSTTSSVSWFTPGSIYGFDIPTTGTYKHFHNGNTVSTGTIPAGLYQDNGNRLMIGNRNDGNGSANFWLPELLLFDKVISATERQTAESTLFEHYLNNDATLSSLTLSNTALNPVFSPQTTYYSAFPPAGLLTISAVSSSTIADMKIRYANGAYIPLENGIPSVPYDVTSPTDIEILVTAQDGATMTYEIKLFPIGDCSFQTSWNGSSWDNGTPNSYNFSAEINGNYSSTGDLKACSLVINQGIVTVNTGHTFDIKGAVTVNDGSLTFKNNARLLQDALATTNGNSGNVTIERDVSLRRLDYVFWGSPVAGQDLKLFSPYTVSPINAPGFPTPTGSSRFYTANESTNSFEAITAPLGTSFAAGKGYMIRAPNTFPANGTPATFNGNFKGVPNNGNYSIGITHTEIPTSQGFNLISNPYPSPISAQAFIDANPDAGTLYFWTHSDENPNSNNYATWNTLGTTPASGPLAPNGFIQTGQGFFLYTPNILATGTQAHFTNAMRRNENTTQFYRNAAVEKHRFWLNLSNATTTFNQALVGYMDGATLDKDTALDAVLNGSGTSISSKISSDAYLTQGRPLPFNVTDVVPLSFNALTAGEYTLGLEQFDGIFENHDIFLKDNLNGAEQNLKSGPYSFASDAGNFGSRFSITYQSTLGIENPMVDANNIVIYKVNDRLHINSGTIVMASVRLFDIRGRLLYSKEGINATSAELNSFDAEQQVLLVQITSNENKILTRKVVY